MGLFNSVIVNNNLSGSDSIVKSKIGTYDRNNKTITIEGFEEEPEFLYVSFQPYLHEYSKTGGDYTNADGGLDYPTSVVSPSIILKSGSISLASTISVTYSSQASISYNTIYYTYSYDSSTGTITLSISSSLSGTKGQCGYPVCYYSSESFKYKKVKVSNDSTSSITFSELDNFNIDKPCFIVPKKGNCRAYNFRDKSISSTGVMGFYYVKSAYSLSSKTYARILEYYTFLPDTHFTYDSSSVTFKYVGDNMTAMYLIKTDYYLFYLS